MSARTTVARAPRGDDAYQQRVTSHAEARVILDTGALDDYLHAFCDEAGISLERVQAVKTRTAGHALKRLKEEYLRCERPQSGEIGYDELPTVELSPEDILETLDNAEARAESGCDLENNTMRDDLEEAFEVGSVGERLIADYYWYAYNDETGDCDDTDFTTGNLQKDAKIRDYYGKNVYAGWPADEEISSDSYIIAQLLEPVSEDGVTGKILGYVDSGTVEAQPVLKASEHWFLDADSRVMWWDELYAPIPKTIVAALDADYNAFLD